MEEIKNKIKSAYDSFLHKLERLENEWGEIKLKCTHPEIGEGAGMYICPDCDYYGGPEYPETLSDRDYDNYDTNIEKTRQSRRKLKAKYARDEIKEMKRVIKEKIETLKSSYALEEKKLYDEWNELKKKCCHLNVTSDKICLDCDSYLDEYLL